MLKPQITKPERVASFRATEEHTLSRPKSFLRDNKHLDEDARKIPRARAAIDVVLVPGLYADFENSWGLGSPTGGVLQGEGIRAYNVETIYSSLPNGIFTRVLQYQYEQSSQNRSLEEHAIHLLQSIASRRAHGEQRTRLLHFAAHSTGGLVVKKALILAQQNQEYRSIFTSCFGVTFFGVPHLGSSILIDPAYAEGIKQELRLSKLLPADITKLLQPENRELKQLNEDFKTKSRKLRRIWTFSEAQDTALEVRSKSSALRALCVSEMRTFIVDKRSSELKVGNETVLELSSNHRNLCKFRRRHDYDILKRYKMELSSVVEEMTTSDAQLHSHLRAEVHLFYQDEKVLADSAAAPRVKLLTAVSNFNKLIDEGPRACLEERLSYNVPEEKTASFSEDGPYDDQGKIPQIQIMVPAEDEALNGPGLIFDEPDSIVPADEAPPDLFVPSPVQRRGTAVSVSASVQSLDDPALRTKHFKWIHVPCNHPAFALDVLDSILANEDESNPNERLMNEYILRSNHNLSHYGLPHSRRMRPQFRWLGTKPKARQALRKSDANPALVIYLPYLHWDTAENLKARNELTKLKRKRSPKEPAPTWVQQLSSIEPRLLWANPDGHGNLHIHQRRSLDQFGYPSLMDTTARDQDQVLYKRTTYLRKAAAEADDTDDGSIVDTLHDSNSSKREGSLLSKLSGIDGDPGKVLMVDQLWLFVTDKDHVVTFFTPKDCDAGPDTARNVGDLRNSIYNDVNGDPVFATHCHTPFEFAALTVLHAVTVLFSRVTDEELQVFDIFDSYISYLTEAQTQSFKRFRQNQEDRALRKLARRKHSTDLDDELEASKDEEDTQDNIRDLQNLAELRDVEDELSTIGRLLDEQSEVVSSMQKYAMAPSLSPGYEDATPRLIKEAMEAVDLYQKRVAKLKAQCKSAHDAYVFLLEMRDKQANIFEARRMRKSARTAEEQNRSIIFFTVFTIIFLPLSFFTSLFGINASNWSGNAQNPNLHQIFIFTFAVSAVVILIALLLAFNKIIRRYTSHIFAHPYRSFMGWIDDMKPAKKEFRVGSGLKNVTSDLMKMEPAKHPGFEATMNGKSIKRARVKEEAVTP